MLSASITLWPKTIFSENRQPIKHAIPSSSERIPVVGMGTSRTFDVGNDPAVTCVIPATSKVHHTEDNRAANFGKLPSPSMRKRMRQHFESL